ncbi:MAG: DUF1559 domain-containing protein [Planctomycetota bacterium]
MRPFPLRRRQFAFTLVELLVVIAIIGILVALLRPAVNSAREAARRSQCINNLRQLSLGLLNYDSAYSSFPIGFEFDEGDNPATLRDIGPNWAVHLLPYIEEQALHDQFDFESFVSDPVNQTPRRARLSVMLCPSDTFNRTEMVIGVDQFWGRGNYAANAGNGPLLVLSGRTDVIYGPDSPGWKDDKRRGVIGPNVANSLRRVTDGTTKSILLGEVRAGVTDRDRRGVWALGQAGSSMLFWYGSTGDDNGPNVCNPYADDVAGPTNLDIAVLERQCMPDWTGDNWADQATVRSMHVGGVVVGMADGSAHFISDDIDTTGIYGDWGPNGEFMSVWDKMIASGDGRVIDDSIL